MKTEYSIHYVERLPKSYSKKTKLLLLIHGYGSDENDLFSFADEFPDNFLVISIRGIYNLPFGGFAWYSIDFMNNEKFTNTKEAKNSIEKINEFVENLSTEYSFDKNDIWLCGFSQGAIISYALGLQFPENYTKLLCLSGYFEEKIISKNIDYNNLSETRIYISHGMEDVVIPIDWARKTNEMLQSKNLNINYNEYYSGHGINPENYRDLMLFVDKYNI